MAKPTEEQDPLAMLAAAQQKAQEIVIRDRVALIVCLLYVKRIHGEDDYDKSVREIIVKHGANGVPMPLLRMLHPDTKKLDKVIEHLKTEDEVTEEKVNKTPILKAA